jgi:hypothetical protein
VVQQSSGYTYVVDDNGRREVLSNSPGSGSVLNSDKFKPVFQYVRYKRRHPGDVIICGMLCGKGFSASDSTLSSCSPFFCVIDVKVAGSWVSLFDLRGAANHEAHIYNLYDFPSERLTVDLSDVVKSEDAVDAYTQRVTASCPVAANFGVDGKGCGAVWRCVECLNHSVWFQSGTATTPTENASEKASENTTENSSDNSVDETQQTAEADHETDESDDNTI